jgi:transcription antitermination factor NusG
VQHITSAAKASEYSYQVLEKSSTRTTTGDHLRVLFPRYIFTVVDRTRDRWRSINGTFGVDRLLMSGGDPQPVPHGLVESLIRADAEGNVHFGFALREGPKCESHRWPLRQPDWQSRKLDDRGRGEGVAGALGSHDPVVLPAHLVAPS